MLMSEFGAKLLEMLAIADVKGVIFANSLIGATIQDGGKRERSDGYMPLHCQNKRKEKENQKKY